jgi:crotonobetainyl-CoA:carnitine CoA-transferase CaiB-like acyl-CoA transferase
VAALLYALSLVLIPLNMLAALAVLMAALLCLPEPRDAIWVRTGVRLGGISTALLAITLVLAALMSAGWQDEGLSTEVVADDVLVVSATQDSKP